MPIKKLKSHREFIGQVGAVMSGRALAAALSLLLTPIVARLYTPDDFGVAALFFAIVSVAVQIASLKYDTAIPLPKDDDEALQITALSYRIVPAFCAVLLGVVAVLWFRGGDNPSVALLGGWIWLLPLTILLMAAQDVQESWLSRKQKFGVIGRSVVLDTGVGQVSRIVSGSLFGSNVAGLIIGQLLGVVAHLVMQGRASMAGVGAAFRRIGWPELRSVAVRYSDFARLNAPAALLYVATQNLPIVIFGLMYSPAVAGLFAMAVRLSRMPVQAASISMRRVFLQRAARIHNEGRSLRRSFTLTTLGLLAIGVPPALVVWFYGEPVLSLVLGREWIGAGRVLESITPWVLFAWVATPCNPVLVVLRRQKLWLSLLLATTIVRFASFAVGHALGFGAEATLNLFVLSSVAAHVLIIAVAFALTARRPAAP